MKLKKSTVIVIVLSWILFFCACFLIFLKLDKEHTEKITNEKIFREETEAQRKKTPMLLQHPSRWSLRQRNCCHL